MKRREFVKAGAMALAALTTGGLTAQGHGHGNPHWHDGGDQGNGNGHGEGHGRGEGGDSGYGGEDGQRCYFPQPALGVVQQYYAGPRQLPPGLQRKLYRTGQLPPGWEKRYQAFPPAVVQQLPPFPPGYQGGYLDGNAIVFDPVTRVIADVMDVLGTLHGQ